MANALQFFVFAFLLALMVLPFFGKRTESLQLRGWLIVTAAIPVLLVALLAIRILSALFSD